MGVLSVKQIVLHEWSLTGCLDNFSFNLIFSISHLYFMYKLSFLLHSLLDNGARMTPKRRSVFSPIFIVN